jgi:hypothetical protein
MQLRSGRSVDASTSTKSTHTMAMRRNSRNYEEFDERRRYQAEQMAIESGIYTSETEIVANKKRQIYSTIRHLLYAIEHQRKNKDKYSWYDIIDSCADLYKFINNNMPFIVDNNAMDERLAKSILSKGIYITNEIYRTDRTRAQSKKVDNCLHYIGNVMDMIEHHVLRRF